MQTNRVTKKQVVKRPYAKMTPAREGMEPGGHPVPC